MCVVQARRNRNVSQRFTGKARQRLSLLHVIPVTVVMLLLLADCCITAAESDRALVEESLQSVLTWSERMKYVDHILDV